MQNDVGQNLRIFFGALVFDTFEVAQSCYVDALSIFFRQHKRERYRRGAFFQRIDSNALGKAKLNPKKSSEKKCFGSDSMNNKITIGKSLGNALS